MPSERDFRDDLRLLLRGWRARSGMKPSAGVDPADVEAAAVRIENEVEWHDELEAHNPRERCNEQGVGSSLYCTLPKGHKGVHQAMVTYRW